MSALPNDISDVKLSLQGLGPTVATMNITPSVSSTSETAVITPGMALYYLTQCKYSRQRNLNQDKVSLYVREMLKGSFVGGTDIWLGVLNGKEYLINGQHRLTAVMNSKAVVEFTIIRKPVATERELDDIYSNLDQQKSRTIADTLRAHDQLFGGYSAGILRSAGAAATLIFRGLVESPDRLKRPSQLDTMRRIHFWKEPLRIYLEAIQGGNMYSRLTAAPYMAIGLLTCKYYPEQAKKFWLNVSRGENLPGKDPSMLLRTFLFNTRIVSNTTASLKDMQGRNSVNRGYISQVKAITYATACWGHFVHERQVKYAKAHYLESKFVITGIDLKKTIEEMEAYNV